MDIFDYLRHVWREFWEDDWSLPNYTLLRRNDKILFRRTYEWIRQHWPRGVAPAPSLSEKEIYLWPHRLRWQFFYFALGLSLPLLVSGAFVAGGVMFSLLLFSQHMLFYWWAPPVLGEAREALRHDPDNLEWLDRSVFFDDTLPPRYAWRTSRRVFTSRSGQTRVPFRWMFRIIRFFSRLGPPLDLRSYPLWWHREKNAYWRVLWFGIFDFYKSLPNEGDETNLTKIQGLRRFLVYHCAPVWVSYLALHLMLTPWYFYSCDSPWTQPYSFGPGVPAFQIVIWLFLASQFLVKEWKDPLHVEAPLGKDSSWNQTAPMNLPTQLYPLIPNIPGAFRTLHSTSLAKVLQLVYAIASGLYLLILGLLWLADPFP